MEKKQVAGAVAVLALAFGVGRLSAEGTVERDKRVHGIDVRVSFERTEDGGLQPVFTQAAFASRRKADGGWVDIGAATTCGAPNAECSQTLFNDAVKTCSWRE